MAHEMLPAHRPHDQLRTEAATQKPHTDKYVSCFSSGDADVDLTFRNPILDMSADHFKVGVDDLTVNLGNLSMIEYGVGDVLFRILRRGINAEVHANFYMVDGPAADLNKWRNAFSFSADRVYNTLQEVLSRFDQIGDAVGTYIRTYGLVGAGIWASPIAANLDQNFLSITVTSNGQLRFAGNQAFWANFVVEVPLEKYRQIFFKSADAAQFRYLSLDPNTGATRVPYNLLANAGQLTSIANAAPVVINDAGVQGLTYIGTGNLLTTLDRRVTIEVGCSLPIKNSPLIDHGVEAPDFVLGRYMFHKPYAMSTGGSGLQIESESLGVQTLQGSRDRVVYHHLKPQQKINTLRLKLWARVRTYSEATKKWSMKTIRCPVVGTDYWHVRLHFLMK